MGAASSATVEKLDAAVWDQRELRGSEGIRCSSALRAAPPSLAAPPPRRAPPPEEPEDARADELRSENAWLQRRVSLLESRLREYEEALGGEDVMAERSRLLWRSAILAVRLRNSHQERNAMAVKMTALEVTARQAKKRLREALGKANVSFAEGAARPRGEEEAKAAKEMQVALALQRARAYRARRGQIFELQRSLHLGVAKHPRRENGTGVHQTTEPESWRTGSAGPSQADGIDSAAWATLWHANRVQKDEIEEWTAYSQALEEKLDAAVCDQRELRRRLRQLEELAARKPWWLGFERVLCGRERPGVYERDGLPPPTVFDV